MTRPYAVTANVMPDAPASAVTKAAKIAEDLGYESVWIFDEGLAMRDVYVTLAAIALGTQTIGLGTGVTNPYTRHPAVTANAIATLDEISEGRAFIGIGAGGGMTLDPLVIDRAAPVAAVREMITALRMLFAGEVVDFDGTTMALRGARLPATRTSLAIWFAGRGPKMLEMAGAHADGVHLGNLHKATIGNSVSQVRSSAGRKVKISLTIPIVTTDADFATARSQLTFRLPDSPQAVRDRLAITATDVAELREALASGGPSGAAQLIREEWVSQFVLMGDGSAWRSELDQIMTGYDIDEFQVQVPTVSEAHARLEAAAKVLAL